MEEIYKSEFAKVEFHEQGAYVLTTWLDKKKITIEQYKEAFTAALDFQELNKERARYFISDIREQGIVPPENRKWLLEVALPKTVSNHLQGIAVVFSGNVFQKYYLNHIMNSTKKFGINMKFYSKLNDAEEWIMKQ